LKLAIETTHSSHRPLRIGVLHHLGDMDGQPAGVSVLLFLGCIGSAWFSIS
jgi:hypothetical protein